MAFHTPKDPGYAPGQELRFNEGFSDDLDTFGRKGKAHMSKNILWMKVDGET